MVDKSKLLTVWSSELCSIRYNLLLIAFISILMPRVLYAGTAYYVDPSAETNGNGSYSSPWNNIPSVNNHSMQTGDDVYFKENVTCTLQSNNDRLVINWSGTSGDRVIIGCYDGNGDFFCDNINYETGANYPVIDGDGSYPAAFGGIIRVQQDYITIQDLKFINSGGGGILKLNAYTGDYLTIQRCWFENIYDQALTIIDSDNSLFTKNYATNILTRNSGDCDQIGGAAMTCDGDIAGSGGCSGTTFSYNRVEGSYGECFGSYRNLNTMSNPIIHEYNVALNCRSSSIHISGSAAIVRYNLAGYYDEGGDGYESYWDNGSWPNCEEPSVSSSIQLIASKIHAGADYNDYEAYGNFVFGNDTLGNNGGISVSLSNDCRAQGDTMVAKIYNNTVVDCDINYVMYESGIDGTADSEVRNNISVYYDTSGTHATETDANNNINWDYNLWSSQPARAAVRGANDPGYANPQLSTQNGYTWPSSATSFDSSAFMLKSISPAINAGTALSAPYSSDYWGTKRPQGTAWDIGAHEYTIGNSGPVVDAGPDQIITLPVDTINLDGTVIDDGLPDPPAEVTTTWTKVSGPNMSFGNADVVDTTASFSAAGTYILRLTADDSEVQVSDDITITVNPDTTPPAKPTGLIIIE